MRGELPDVQNRDGAMDWLLLQELITDLATAERQVLDQMTLQELALRREDEVAGWPEEEGA